jgi:hypothetical protein
MRVFSCVRGLLLAGVLLVGSVVGVLVGVPGAVSVAGAVGACGNEAFRIGPSAALPDCRAYEMVSPPDKNGGEVDGGIVFGGSILAPPEQAAADGESVTYGSTSAFLGAEVNSALVATQYVSTRTAAGWRTRAVTPTQEVPEGKINLLSQSDPDWDPFQGFNESLGDGFLLAWEPQPDPSAPADYFNPYLYERSGGEYQLLSDGATPPVQPPGAADLAEQGFAALYAGMSADGRHVIFEANDKLTPEAVPGRVNLYEWSAGQPLELVSVLPDGAADTLGASHIAVEGSTGLQFGSPTPNASNLVLSFTGVLSSDGRRAFWSGGSAAGGQVYMHEITESEPRSVDISASQKSGEPDAPSHFWDANSEGSLVYFTSAGELTEDSTAAAGRPDLYQYDANTGVLRDITVDPNAGESADVLGVLGSGGSEAVPYVYFVAGGKLAAGASVGADNLYVWQGGAGGEPGAIKLVATLGGYEAENLDFAEGAMERTSRVSPDGTLLAFQSAEPLTGYDNRPTNGQSCPAPVAIELNANDRPYEKIGGACMEVFEYDAANGTNGRLVCASCDPTGLPPTADSLIPESRHLGENAKGWESSTVQQRYLLDDGRLYFQSEDALLPEATNDKQNIYEYEPEGVGQCAPEGSGGCLYLISTGESSGNSYFVDASSDGRDVFLLTDQQLVTQDGDEATDMYDAREDGGFASAQPPPCSGEACKPAVTPAPAIYGAPSSATFQGAGNISAQPEVKPSSAKTAKKKKSKLKRKTKKAKRKIRGRKAAKSGVRSAGGRQ